MKPSERFENTPRHICSVIFLSHRWSQQWSPRPIPLKCSLKCFLTQWPWPLIYDLDLQTWPRYLSTWPPCQKSSPSVCLFVRESGNRQTHRQCQNSYTRHWGGCKNVPCTSLKWLTFPCQRCLLTWVALEYISSFLHPSQLLEPCQTEQSLQRLKHQEPTLCIQFLCLKIKYMN